MRTSLVARCLFSGIALVGVSTAVACGSSTTPESGFSDTPSTKGDGGGSGSGSASGSGSSTIGTATSQDGGISLSSAPTGTEPSMEAGVIVKVTNNCSGTSATASRKPVKLLVLLDQSYSMGGDPDTQSEDGEDGWLSRWQPVTGALESFFQASGSKGISAALDLFPNGAAKNADGSYVGAPECTADYSTPEVPFTGLPTSGIPLPIIGDPFVLAIGSAGPLDNTYNPSGLASDTPTQEALTGAYSYVNGLAQNDTSTVYAVVLVTDGDPCGCNYASACPSQGATTAPAAAAAAASSIATATITPETAAGIPTYVIGVGPDAQNLDTLASAGGTGAHIPVMAGSNAGDQLTAALDKIRTQSISCNYPIPPAPDGQTYDLQDVNVELSSGSNMTPLAYSAGCTGDTAGWHYDSLTAPTQIELCDATCNSVKADANASVQVVFGCETTTIIPGYDGGVTVR